jgi:DNA uptake protein ComE-like DNA-binding protein
MNLVNNKHEKKNSLPVVTPLFSSIYAQHDTLISQRKVAYMDIKSYRYHKMNVNHAIDSIGLKLYKMILSSQWQVTKQRFIRGKRFYILDRYKEIVYNKYQNKMQKIVPTMKTWKNEIKIYFDKSVNTNYQKFVEFTKYLDQEDSLKISLVKDKKSNYFIYGMENICVNLDPRILAMRVIIWSGIINKEYSCSLKLNIQNSLSEEQITSLKMNFIRSLGYFMPSLIIWTVLVIFQVVLLTKKNLEKKILKS